MIRRLAKDDVNEVVKIHLRSFPGFFLSFLGPRFLTIFYSGICTAREGIGFVYVDDACLPVGFVAGTENPRGFYSRLLRRDWFRFAIAAIFPVLKKPSIIGRLARAFLHPADNPIGYDVAGLYSIAVLPSIQNSGAGKSLVLAFLEEAMSRRCKRVFLTTDRDNNEAVCAFYEKLGFRIERQYITREGRRMNEFWITLSRD